MIGIDIVPKRCTDVQRENEKRHTGYWEGAKPSREITAHLLRWLLPKSVTSVARMWRHWNLRVLLVGGLNGATALENYHFLKTSHRVWVHVGVYTQENGKCVCVRKSTQMFTVGSFVIAKKRRLSMSVN